MKTLAIFALLCSLVMAAQQQQPQVRVNVLNVCTPSESEQKEIVAALARIPQQPAFAADFEVARGRSTSPEGSASRWVRIRREFPAASPFATVQYSFSLDEKNSVVETVVFRLRQAKDVIQVAIEQSQADASPADALAKAPAATRIRLERFGQSSIALARCAEADQSAYEPLFRAASNVLVSYRAVLNARRTVPLDLARVGPANRK